MPKFSAYPTITSIPVGSLLLIDTYPITITSTSSITWANATAGLAISGANSNITSLSGLTTPLSIAQGGTGNTTGIPSTNANLTGPITSVGNATSVAAQTGTGSTFVMQTSPTINSPTLTAPVLGTPASGTLTNASGLPIAGLTGLGTGVATLLGQTSSGTGGIAGISSPSFTTPALGAATATSINGLAITSSTGTLTITNAKTLSVTNSLTLSGTDSTIMTFPTTSATIARTDAANTFTGHQTIEGVTTTGAQGTGALVFATSPSLTTPTLGVAGATSINKVTITAPATSATLTIANGKTLTANNSITIAGVDTKILTVNNSLTLAGTDSTTMTFPSTSATIARTDAANTFTGVQVFSSLPTIPAVPSATTDAASKSYVDGVAAGLSIKASVQEATAAALPTNTYLAGVITITATGTLTVDGTAVQLNDRVLVKNEATQANNGIYTCTTFGTTGIAAVLTRSTDSNTSAEIVGAFTFCEQGTANADSGFVNTNTGSITIGVTSITYTQFSGAGEITAGTGLTKSGNTLSVTPALPVGTIVGTTDTQTLTNKTIAGASNTLTVRLASDVTGNLPVGNLGSGTAASSSTFWRGDATWATPSGSGNVSGPGSSVNNDIVTFNGTSGTTIADSGFAIASTATASTVAARDASVNLTTNAFIPGFTSTATAAGTTTMTITSTETQVWTGSTTQTVKLPTTSVAAGGQYKIINPSTGAVTVQSSGANTITILAAGTSAVFTAVVATPTTAANWNSQYLGLATASAKVLTASNSLTLAGTDATTMTFPSSSDTVVGLAATQTLTNKTLTSPTIVNNTNPVMTLNSNPVWMYLGYTQITANLTTTSTSVVYATGLTVTVTIPTGATAVKITAYTNDLSNTAANNATLSIWSGASAGTLTTQLQSAVASIWTNSANVPITCVAIIKSPSSGSITYNVGYLGQNAGTTTITAAATAPAYILVECC